ncbi:MAG: co-chaperone GroES [Nannocystales bacterium]
MAEHDSSQPPESDPPDNEAPARVRRHVQPVGPRVLVRILKGPDRAESGLFLPQGVKEDHAAALLGEVLEVARTMPKADNLGDDLDDDDDDDDELRLDLGKNVSGIPLGANVLFEKQRGIAVPWDETLRLLEVRHVLALVDIISEDELQ